MYGWRSEQSSAEYYGGSRSHFRWVTDCPSWLQEEALPKPSAVSTHTLSKGLERLSFPALIATALAGLIGLAAMGQDDGQIYRSVKAGGHNSLPGDLTCWPDLSKDNTIVGLSNTQGDPYRSFPIDGEVKVQ